MKTVLVTLCLCFAIQLPEALAGQLESAYVQRWCADHNGTAEYRLQDGTRVDCVTATHAVEVDHACKWAEAIGQSMHYSACTGKGAGIVLIVGPDDSRFVKRLKNAARRKRYYVDVW
ncbi:hypothetical protein ADUPG1_005139, partial [Aduncisulcus paluster]